MQIVRIFSASIAGFLSALWAWAFGFGDKDPQSFGGVYILAAASYVVAVAATYMMTLLVEGRVGRPQDTCWVGLTQGLKFSGKSPVSRGLLVLFAV